MLGIFALCVGAGVAECLLNSRAGLRGGLTIAAGFKLIQAVSVGKSEESRCTPSLISVYSSTDPLVHCNTRSESARKQGMIDEHVVV